MASLLYIVASPRGERSYSRAVGDAFVTAYKEAHPSDTVDTLDLYEEELPPFEGFTIQAKYAVLHGKDHTEEEAKAWKAVEAVADRFKSADKLVVATPMWNFSVPYRLKHYIDVLVQPGLAFSYSPDTGFTGLITGRPYLGIYARSGDYSQGSGAEELDLQTRYMETILGFIGFEEMRSIVIEPTILGGPDKASEKRAEALEAAKRMATGF